MRAVPLTNARYDTFGSGTRALDGIYMKKVRIPGASPELLRTIYVTASVSVRYMHLQE